MSKDPTENSSLSQIDYEANNAPQHTSTEFITKSSRDNQDKHHDNLKHAPKRQRLVGSEIDTINDHITNTNDNDTGKDRNFNASEIEKVNDDNPAPLYGSKEYWEERYKKNLPISEKKEKQQKIPAIDENKEKSLQNNTEELPYHSWYFTYDEIKPIILPLLLGGRDEEMYEVDEEDEYEEVDGEDEESCEDNDEEEDGELSEEDEENELESTEQVEENQKVSDGSLIQEEIHLARIENNSPVAVEIIENEVSNESNEENMLHEKQNDGLSSAGPVRVLEIGCGDVPLGIGLVENLLELQQETGTSIANIVSKVICTDYSHVVIDMMKKKYATNSSSGSDDTLDIVNSNVLEFEEGTAMNMDKYQNGSFQLILEKGLFDAMLSDEQDGVDNCIQAVAECARLLTPRIPTTSRLDETNAEVTPSDRNSRNQGIENLLSVELVTKGCLILCSHLNANNQKGLDWLQDVVIAGLLHGTSDDSDRIGWRIEVHANSGDESMSTQYSDKIDDDRDDIGPAVYVIHKFLKTTPTANLDSSAPSSKVPIDADVTCRDKVFANIPLVFVSYDK